MTVTKFSAAVMIAGLLGATPVLAQSTMNSQMREPGLQNPGGVAGGFASANSKDAANKQKAESDTSTTNEDTLKNGKQK
jgi:hypothetical protein